MSQHLPGYEVGRSMVDREVLFSGAGLISVPVVLDGNKAIDGANGSFTYEIRAGWLMGRVTTGGLWRPCPRTTASGSGSSSTALVVVNAAAFRAGDTIKIGSNANVVANAINYATNTLTLASAQSWSSGDAVRVQDGSETCRGVLLDFVKLRTDDNTLPASRSAGMAIQGAVKAGMLLGDAAAIRADTAAKLAGIRFSDEHGQ